MKKHLMILAMLALASALVIMAFTSPPYRPHSYEPIMMSRAALEASIAFEPARAIEKPGKLWVYNNYIMLIEQYRGIHVIDNSNPNDPQRIHFIRIEGCTEVAVRDGILYASNAVDLIGIKATSDFASLEVVSRNRNVLPSVSSPEHWNDWYYTDRLKDDMIIIRWEPLTD